MALSLGNAIVGTDAPGGSGRSLCKLEQRAACCSYPLDPRVGYHRARSTCTTPSWTGTGRNVPARGLL